MMKWLWIACLMIFFAAKPAASFAILTDTEIETGVRTLVNPIIKAAGMQPDDVKIYIMLEDDINAFVAGGKNIFIFAGLLRLFNDPDVIKGVVAHELGHITSGHLARNQEKIQEVMNQSMVTTLLGAAVMAVGGGPAGLAAILGGMHGAHRSFMSHSRTQESSSDQVAVRLLHATNNTVGGMVKFFDYLMRKQLSEEYQIFRYAMTHPLDKDRMNIIKLALKQEASGYGSTDSERKMYSRIVAKLDGFLASPEAVLKINQKNLDPFARNYEMAIALYRMSQLAQSTQKLDELIAIEPTNAYLHQLKGQFLFEHGKVLEAMHSYQQALKYLPNDPSLTAEYAVTIVNSLDLMTSKQSKEEALTKVINLLNAGASKDFKNPYVYRNLAIAYGKLGDLANSNLMLAEEALEYGRTDEARRFALQAQKYPAPNARVKLKIEDLLKALHDGKNDDRRSDQ